MATILPVTPHTAQHFLTEELPPVALMIKKIQRVSEEKLSKTTLPMIKHWLGEFRRQSPLKSSLIILALPVYAPILGLGAIASYASIRLLLNADFSSAFSSDIDERVNFANNITNSGALFACITDLPAALYAFYFLGGIKSAYQRATEDALADSYHSCITQDPTLTRQMHEELYQWHITEFKNLRLDHFYVRPDLLSETGVIHRELAPVLELIDKELQTGVSLHNLGKNCIQKFREDSCAKKSAKIAGGSVALGMMTLASFLILESIILVRDTPVSDLFSSDTTAQTNEAFYLTQLSCFLASLTAFGAALYLSHLLFVQAPYRKTMHQKIEYCFAQYAPADLSVGCRTELNRIRDVKKLVA